MNYNDFFQKTKEKKIKNIQITEITINNSDLEIINKSLESYNINSNTSYEIKAEYNNKTVKVNTEYLDETIIDLIITKATYTDSSYQDEYLTDTKNNNNEELKETTQIDTVLDRLYKIDDFRKDKDNIKELDTYYIEKEKKIRIINSNNVDIATTTHLYEFTVRFVLENNKNAIIYSKTYLKTNYDELKMEEAVSEIYKEAEKMLEKQKLETKKYDIILSSQIASRIISHLAAMASATNIRLKTSCLENKLNEKIFSEKLSIVEDPTEKKYPGYSLFDNEGTKTYKKDIVKNGILKTYLYNLKEAKEKGLESTGNGYGQITTRNMYVIPGKLSKTELIKKLNNGIYITEYMGASGTSINLNTGNISLQVFGLVIENGKIKCGFDACVMTTNIFELLRNIEEVGNNLEFSMQSSASPDLLIKNISIASS